MRIVHLVESLDRGGLERVVCDLALQQKRNGHEVSIFCLFHGGSLANEPVAGGVEVVLGAKRPGLDLAAVRRLRSHVRARRTDVLHTHNPVCNYYAALAFPLPGSRPRIVNTRHNMGASNPRDARERYFRWSLIRTSRVVMVSNKVADRFSAGGIVAAGKLRVQTNGIPISRYHAATPQSRATARSLLNLPQDVQQTVVMAVGRLVTVKNHELLLESTASLKTPGSPSLKLVIVGEGPLRSHLTELAGRLGLKERLVLAGERLDVPAILPAADVYVLPSLSEGHSIALLEAAATGLPIVATNVGGNGEIIRDRQTGLLVPTRDVDALTRALDTLISDRNMAATLGRQARAWAETTASVEHMASGYDDIYGELFS